MAIQHPGALSIISTQPVFVILATLLYPFPDAPSYWLEQTTLQHCVGKGVGNVIFFLQAVPAATPHCMIMPPNFTYPLVDFKTEMLSIPANLELIPYRYKIPKTIVECCLKICSCDIIHVIVAVASTLISNT